MKSAKCSSPDCALAEDDDVVYLHSLSAHECPMGRSPKECGIHFVGDTDGPFGMDGMDTSSGGFLSRLSDIRLDTNSPLVRGGALVLILVAVWLVVSQGEDVVIDEDEFTGGGEQKESYPPQSPTGDIDCATLPNLPRSVDLLPSVDTQRALRENALSFIQCGQGDMAQFFLREAAETGDARAALSLGDIYNPVYRRPEANGGPLASFNSARLWYLKALELDAQPLACTKLAALYAEVERLAATDDGGAVALLHDWKDLSSICATQ